jgi:predicted HicB family RNase H-like nuclease
MSDIAQSPRKLADAAAAERRSTPRHRLVVEVSPDLHRRILTICATRGKRVNEAVREVLERAFPS